MNVYLAPKKHLLDGAQSAPYASVAGRVRFTHRAGLLDLQVGKNSPGRFTTLEYRGDYKV